MSARQGASFLRSAAEPKNHLEYAYCSIFPSKCLFLIYKFIVLVLSNSRHCVILAHHFPSNMVNNTTIICDESDIVGLPKTWDRWFPVYDFILQPTTAKCIQKLHDDPATWGQQSNNWIGYDTNCPSVLGLISCVWSELPVSVSIQFQIGQIILGLAPSLLSFMAPSISEISLLSSSRPVLAMLLSLCSPSVYLQQILTYQDPLRSLCARNHLFRRQWIPAIKRWSDLISVVEYSLALGAIANIFNVSWQLGLQTIVAWDPINIYAPFLWSSLLPPVVHVISALGWYYSRCMRRLRETNQTQDSSSFIGFFRDKEFLISAAKPPLGYIHDKKQGEQADEQTAQTEPEEQEELYITVFCNQISGFFAYVAIGVGTVFLSSLLFIGPGDAGLVFVRYAASTVVGRLIITFELVGMATVEDRKKRRCDPNEQQRPQTLQENRPIPGNS